MKKHTVIISAALAVCLSGSASATVGLIFTNPFSGNIASNFGNFDATTTGSNDMLWGIIVDNTGDGFDTGSYLSGFTFTDDASAISLVTSGGASDDILYIGSVLTSDTSSLNESGGASGSNGTINELLGLDISAVSAGDSFGLIWFDSNDVTGSSGVIDTGDNYGFFTDASFIMPADGTAGANFDSVFIGVDSVRTASLAFAAVPEPSSIALLALGSVALLLRRSR